MKVMCIFGTRPEAIKMAPLVRLLKEQSDIKTRVCVSGQHRDMLDQVLDAFDIVPDHDLSVMKPNQDLTGVTTAVLGGLQDIMRAEKPDWTLVHGDTTTSMAAAMAAFYARCRIGHVEAGLRTGNLLSPWPEEMNRVVTDSMADLMFAPTATARQNLLRENLDPARVVVTGNTVIDALHMATARIQQPDLQAQFSRAFPFLDPARKLVLVTAHRRESFGEGIRNICKGLRALANSSPDADIVYPVHPNPNIQEPVREHLGGLPNVHLIAPQDYLPFTYLMHRATLILTDSGGVQEEAPALGKPVLVLRETTERPEAVAAGAVVLVGSDAWAIQRTARSILENEEVRQRFARAVNPYGDGKASARIVACLRGEVCDEFRPAVPVGYIAAAE